MFVLKMRTFLDHRLQLPQMPVIVRSVQSHDQCWLDLPLHRYELEQTYHQDADGDFMHMLQGFCLGKVTLLDTCASLLLIR